MFFDDWIDGNTIGHESLIYRRGGLIPVGNISKMRFPSFPHQKHTKNQFGNKLDLESRTSRLSLQRESGKPTFVGSGRCLAGGEGGSP